MLLTFSNHLFRLSVSVWQVCTNDLFWTWDCIKVWVYTVQYMSKLSHRVNSPPCPPILQPRYSNTHKYLKKFMKTLHSHVWPSTRAPYLHQVFIHLRTVQLQLYLLLELFCFYVLTPLELAVLWVCYPNPPPHPSPRRQQDLGSREWENDRFTVTISLCGHISPLRGSIAQHDAIPIKRDGDIALRSHGLWSLGRFSSETSLKTSNSQRRKYKTESKYNSE